MIEDLEAAKLTHSAANCFEGARYELLIASNPLVLRPCIKLKTSWQAKTWPPCCSLLACQSANDEAFLLPSFPVTKEGIKSGRTSEKIRDDGFVPLNALHTVMRRSSRQRTSHSCAEGLRF